jgi:hypothetical protein
MIVAPFVGPSAIAVGEGLVGSIPAARSRKDDGSPSDAPQEHLRRGWSPMSEMGTLAPSGHCGSRKFRDEGDNG